MTEKLKIDLSYLSKYRTELMGVSAIGILMCHACGNNVSMPSLLWQIFSLGQLGVPIFFLLSGMGLYYSLTQSKFSKVKYWYAQRFSKLLVPYLLMSIPYYLGLMIINNKGLSYFFINVSTLEYWRSGGGVWFVGAIIPLYLIVPWWHRLLSNIQHTIIPTLIIFITLLLCGDWRGLNEVAFFFLGYWLGKPVSDKKNANMAIWVLIPVVFYVLCKQLPTLNWVPRSLFLVIPFLFVAALAFDKVGQWLNKPFTFMGKISLESYMANVMLPAVFAFVPWSINGKYYNEGNRLLYLCVIVFGIIIAYFVHRISNPIVVKIITNIKSRVY